MMEQHEISGQDADFLDGEHTSDAVWDTLAMLPLDAPSLKRNKLISVSRDDIAYQAIDMLRTQLLQVLEEHGWKKVGIISATSGCGKTFVAANLAVSIARGGIRRVILMDMNLRNPTLAGMFGVTNPPKMSDFLLGYSLPEEFFLKVDHNLALGLNAIREDNAAEFMLDKIAGDVLAETEAVFSPDVILYDLPAISEHDDVAAFLPQLDGVLLIVGAGKTTASEIKEVEQLLGDKVPLIAAVLNNAPGSES